MADDSVRIALETVLYAILPHTREPRILLLADAAAWTLPRFTVPTSDQVWDLFEAGMHAQAVVGCATETLYCPFYAPQNEEHASMLLFVLDNLDSTFQAPEGARWVDQDGLAELSLADETLRPEIERYFEERAMDHYPAQRPLWAFAGWMKRAKTWVQAQVMAHGWTLTGDIELVRKWCITCVLKAPTSVGDLYFKAVPPTFAREVGITKLLAELHPEHVPTIVAANEEERWLLLRDFGQAYLGESGAVEDWEQAARDFASLQMSMSRQIDALFARGAMDYRLERLPEKLDALLADETMLMPNDQITAAEIERLRSFVPRIKALITELVDYGLPATLVHGDFHVWNTAVQGERTIFFDWTDAAVGHPFFDMALFFNSMEQAEAFAEQPESVARLREVYLEALAGFAPLETMRKALPLGETLGFLHQAVNYRHLMRSVEPEEHWTLNYIGYQLKRLLTRLEEKG